MERKRITKQALLQKLDWIRDRVVSDDLARLELHCELEPPALTAMKESMVDGVFLVAPNVQPPGPVHEIDGHCKYDVQSTGKVLVFG